MSTTNLRLVTAAARKASPQAVELAGPVRPRLGEILARAGLVTADQVAQAVDAQSLMGARLGDVLRMQAGLSKTDLLAALQRQWQAGAPDLEALPPDPALARIAGVERCLDTLCLPWRRIGGRTVVATALPDQFEAQRPALEAVLGPTMMALAGQSEIQAALARQHGTAINARAEQSTDAATSCRAWRGSPFRKACLALAAATVAMLAAAPIVALAALMGFAALSLLAQTGLKLATLLPMARAAPDASLDPDVVPLHTGDAGRRPVVSILVPIFREQHIAERLIRRLGRLRYPAALLDVILVMEVDDHVTEAVIAATPLPPWMRVVRVPEGQVRTKPRAMNYALGFCRGSIVGIYDAEDAPAPDQIDRIVARFAVAAEEVACLQGRLDFYNTRQNWVSRCFTIDYAAWFGVVLPGIARLGLAVPLGGTTLFFRRDVLERLGGWDAHNVTEDADLGLRLARAGYRTELIDTTTGEEANCRVWPWIRQRSRWQKGYAMTYAAHMRDPAALWRDLGPRGFVGMQVMFAGSLLQALMAPLLWIWWLGAVWGLPAGLAGLPGWAIWPFVALLLMSEATTFAVSLTALRRTGKPNLYAWALAMNFYNMLASIAVWKALIEMAHRPFFWDKTTHGAESAPAAAGSPPGPVALTG